MLPQHTLKRTPKLLIALNSGISCVVGLDYLEHCLSSGELLPVDVMANPPSKASSTAKATKTAKTSKASKATGKGDKSDKNSKEGDSSEGNAYLVCDKEREKKWHFSLLETLQSNASAFPAKSLPYLLSTSTSKDSGGILEEAGEAPTETTGVFSSYRVYVYPEILGKACPTEEETRQLVSSGGGEWLQKMPLKSDLQNRGFLDKLILVASDATVTAFRSELCAEIKIPIYSPDVLFMASLRQQLILEQQWKLVQKKEEEEEEEEEEVPQKGDRGSKRKAVPSTAETENETKTKTKTETKTKPKRGRGGSKEGEEEEEEEEEEAKNKKKGKAVVKKGKKDEKDEKDEKDKEVVVPLKRSRRK